MGSLESTTGLLLLAAIVPTIIAVRLGNVLERASGLAAMQIGLSTWLVAAAIAQLAPTDGRWLAHVLAIAVPACAWAGARQWRDVHRPWLLPIAAAVVASIADLAATASGDADPALRDAFAAVVLVHAGAAGFAAAAELVREGVARKRSQSALLWIASGLPPLFAAGRSVADGSALALDPLSYLPLAGVLGWIVYTHRSGVYDARDLAEPMVIVEGCDRVVDANAAAFALLGVRKHSVRVLRSTLIGIPGLRRMLEDPSCECGEFFTGANADTRCCYEARVVQRQSEDPHRRAIAIQDVTARRESERQLLHQARFDSLTGLANRRCFLVWLENALTAARASNGALAVMYIDLDRFKSINDTYGHGAGDELLRIIAQRLRQRLRSGSAELQLADPFLARFGGDEFAMLLPRIAGVEETTRVASWLLEVLAEPVMIEGKKIWNAGSVGISLHPDHGQDVDSLLRAADIALYHAKKHRRGGYQLFDAALTEATQRRASIDRQLRGATESNGLAVHYQPKYGTLTRELLGAEALLRWHDVELGVVTPKEFIPVAEESGLICQVGNWVLDTVCRDLERWGAEGRGVVPISINVSSRQFAEANMSRLIADALDRHHIDPRMLEIELTERSILENDEKTGACLREIRAIGVRVSLDDFGTGYSSLSYLNRVPLDLLKIDHSLVRDIHLDPGAEGVLSAVVSMAHSLGLEVVAEGADCEEQLAVLSKIGCDAVQGFVFAAAMPERAFAALLDRGGADDLLPAERVAKEAPERPLEVRLLVVDDGSAQLGVLAMRLNRIGAIAIYASDADEALLLAAECGAPIRALMMRSNANVASVQLLVNRIAQEGRAPALLFVGDDVAKPLADLRSRCRIWSLREPLLDATLRDVTRAALYGTPPGAAQRQHPRIAVDLAASVVVGDRSEAAVMSSLSIHGASLELAKRPPIGSRIDVSFAIEDLALRARAIVLYHSESAGDPHGGGIGVRFEVLSAPDAEAIEALIEQRSVRCLG